VLGSCQGVIGGGAGGGSADGSGAAGGVKPGTIDVGTQKPLTCDPSRGSNTAASTWRRLTAQQYRNTVRDLLGVDADTSGFLLDSTTGPFATNAHLAPEETDIDQYRVTAEKVAAAATADVNRLLDGCDAATQGQDTCAARFIDDFGRRAFRHALSTEERTALTTLYEVGKEESFEAGLRLVIEGALQAPGFVYITEFGLAAGGGPLLPLDGYEIASRLSYLLWNSMPDEALFESAAKGELDTAAGIRAAAERLLTSERFIDSVTSFHAQLLRISTLEQPGVVSKDPAKHPEYDDAMKQAMLSDVRNFIKHVFTEGDGSIQSLFTSSVAFPSGELIDVYGASPASSDGGVELADGTRTGILTRPAVLAAVPAVPTRFQAVLRGNMIRRVLLCDTVPPPNVAVNFELPPNAEELSPQELLRSHRDNPSCSSCHELMDPLGFGFENYDGVGKYSTTLPSGDAVDSSGFIKGSDVEGEFRGPDELMQKLATSETVRECMATQWFRFALAREPEQADACAVVALRDALVDASGDVRQALVSLVSSDAFRFRRGE
jgi:hypothetical protein